MSADGTYDVDDASCIAETAKAVLVRIDGKDVWIPKSVVHEDSEVYAYTHTGTLIVLAWWAEQEGLI